MPLRFHADVVAHLSERDLDMPALDKPAQDLSEVLGLVGAEQSLGVELAQRVANENPPYRDDGHPASISFAASRRGSLCDGARRRCWC